MFQPRTGFRPFGVGPLQQLFCGQDYHGETFRPRTLDQPNAEAEDEGLPVPVPPGDPPLQVRGRQSPEQYKKQMDDYTRKVQRYQTELDNLAAIKAARAGVTGTTTVEREQLLYVTIAVDVDKFK